MIVYIDKTIRDANFRTNMLKVFWPVWAGGCVVFSCLKLFLCIIIHFRNSEEIGPLQSVLVGVVVVAVAAAINEATKIL